MSTDSILWTATSRAAPPPTTTLAPARVDVAIIGGGYTGLAAARALARAGASVVVLEAETIGFGASSRNGGFVLPGYKAGAEEIARRLGLETARTLFRDSLAALEFVERLVAEEGITCGWRRAGHIALAAKPGHLRGLIAEQQFLAGALGHATRILSPAELGAELGSTHYHGGLLDESAGALQPVEYLCGLAGAAARAGATLVERTRVGEIRRQAGGFDLLIPGGQMVAREVLVATNGYTGRLVPWLAQRVVPVGSFIIATEPLSPELSARLIPHGRVLSDTRNLLYYFRLSTDRRLVFGGRAAFRPEALAQSLDLLRRGMVQVFPELAPVAVEHGWGGSLGFTRDHLPHAGLRDGVAYALGYCGHGVALASWLGHQVGQALAGRGEWPLLSRIRFPGIPLYRGRPWFLPLAGAYYRVKDWLS